LKIKKQTMAPKFCCAKLPVLVINYKRWRSPTDNMEYQWARLGREMLSRVDGMVLGMG